MKVIRTAELVSERVISCPKGGFVSHRLVLESDQTGYSISKTVIPPTGRQFWHYKNHIESCYCVSGKALLTNSLTNEFWAIGPDTTYVLDNHDPHYFDAIEETVLICVFNPPLAGREVHREDGSYDLPESRFKSPVYEVKGVPFDKVKANDYNPNKVAPPEMQLLETSIWEDGYTQPIVTYYDPTQDMYIVVDGFHRFATMRSSQRIRERENNILPVVVINKEIGDRMASTIRHNRARGTHNVELMSTIVAELVEMGKGDRWICQHIGMSPDELLRLKQITGVAALFANRSFSDSWDAENADDLDDDEAPTFEQDADGDQRLAA
ncbi:MAG: ectoine synthase [Blastocatellia bacterium]|nr:ectoine synthase [Blastocatellia bacterium]